MSGHHAGCQYDGEWHCTQDCLHELPEMCGCPDACSEVKKGAAENAALLAEVKALRLKLDETERAGADIRRKNEALLFEIAELRKLIHAAISGLDKLVAWQRGQP